MDCESIRGAISASLDGEDAGVSADVTRAHLDGCAACRDWRERQHALTRRARLSGYALEHDLTARVLGALPAPAIRPSRMPVARRLALASVAAGQLAITVPLLIFGHDREAGLHAAHELGSFDLALAIAFAVGAVRPRLSAGLAWPCCVAALGLAGTAVADVAAGRTFGADEALHLVAVAGALLLFWQSRALSSRTFPADSATVTTAPRAADATGWSGDVQRPAEQGRPVARRGRRRLNIDTGLSPDDPTLEAAFRAALLHQGLIAAGALALLWLVWGASRNWVPASADGRTTLPEPRGRRVLRIGFGVLWLFDGLLQAQPQMAAGLPSQVITPAAQGSPSWVLRLVNWGGTAWAYHPVQAAAAAVWIQVGIGLWLLVAPRGGWSRLAGVASVVWGLSVWVFGEAFGSIFAPGTSWLTGAPGAALLYVAAGVFVALPFTAWRGRLPGRVLLGAVGLFFLGMAAMQAWPGNGFWRGGSGGPLASMAATMAQTPQPHVIARLVANFGTFTAGSAFAVNLVVVIVLAAGGLAFGVLAMVSGPPAGLTVRVVRFGRITVIAGAVLCLAVWVLFQDFRFFGGLGTDPNSMIPTILLFSAAYVAVAPEAAPTAAPEPAPAQPLAESAAVAEAPAAQASGQEPAWQRALAGVSLSSVAAFGALAIVALGAVPMAAASANGTADPIIAEAFAGYSQPLQEPAPDFALTNQDGQPASLSGFRGKVVLLTFLDPVCTTDCTFMGQEFLRAGKLLAADRSRVELVGVVVNPDYYSQAVVRAYDQQEGLSALPDWEYLTGTPAQLEKAWRPYGVVGESLSAGAMIAHNDLAYVIDQSGQIRQELDFDPGPGTSASVSSFAGLLANDAHQLLGAS